MVKYNDDYDYLNDLKENQENISDEVWDIIDDDEGFEFRDLDLYYSNGKEDKIKELVEKIKKQIEKENEDD
jgi:hypothetical protein